MTYSLEIDCIWQKLRVFAFNPDAAKGVESYRLGQVSKEFSPGVRMAKLSHCGVVMYQRNIPEALNFQHQGGARTCPLRHRSPLLAIGLVTGFVVSRQ
ncbi:MAG: hypothetical protein ABI606_08585 [Rhodoferax sp.]